ncbi:MAG: hypothetical protein GQ552_08105 [Flavobacteriaceae bacterium]|nr:hypothetical protein [Flavobacteriaceae bacterium]
MIKNRITYNITLLLSPFKLWIVFCFILFLGIKPVINFISIVIETKLELTERISFENLEAKESNTADDLEILLYPTLFTLVIYIKPLISYFKNQEQFSNINFDIHLPPPKS